MKKYFPYILIAASLYWFLNKSSKTVIPDKNIDPPPNFLNGASNKSISL